MDDLLNHAQQLANQPSTPIIQPIEGRVAYLVNQGYGTGNSNTQQLAEALNQQGLETLCMVRPGWPWDADRVGKDHINPEDHVNGVRYMYSPMFEKKIVNEQAKLETTVERLVTLMRVHRPAVILSETKEVGLAAWIASKRLGLAFYGVVDGFDKKNNGVIEQFLEGKVIGLYSYVSLISKNFNDLFSDGRKEVPVAAYRCSNSVYNVLTIMDEFTQDCFESEFNLISASNKKWREQLDGIDFFFAESAWRGNGGTWNYSMSKVNGKFGKPLKELLYECRLRCIPTVFWNKEDPVNYDVFIEAAKLFDYIFTTDASVIDKYKEDAGHGRVYLLKFAAQEKLHAPILKGDKNGRVAFAGSWNGKKYPTRAKRLEMLFEYPLKQGVLDIYDRYSSLENAAPGLVYPEKYKTSLLPAVPYNKIADQVYKKYSVMINVNSVEDSSSMLARRIYELCGCGTPIVSSPANSLKDELSEIVQVANTAQESREKITRILDDDIHALKIAAKGVRFVHSANTYRHRFSEILDKVVEGGGSKGIERFSVTAVCVSKRPWFAANVAKMLKAQNSVDVKVIYVAHGEETDEGEVSAAFKDFKSFKFMRITGEDKVLADGLNLALDACDTDIVAKIDDDDHYGPNYLLDSCLALQYSSAALVGKTSFFCYVESTNDFALRFPGKHYRYFKRVQGGTLVWSRKMTGNLRFTKVRQGTDSIFIKDLLDSGRKVFSADPFNFVHVRYSSGNNHTWAIDDGKFLEAAKKLSCGLDLELAFN
ncbi:glycosyltransferase family protein [Vreelandella zhaodongensis]|uniref:glycosyltransferase family protein n=1 Tax=Vreelandella zhaodongensis TaxID=1176240 RepID=UPI003EBC352B